MALDVKQPKGYRKAWNGGVRPVTGVDLIAEERARQVSGEGWTPEHDDGHGGGETAMAAACYAAPGLIYVGCELKAESFRYRRLHPASVRRRG